MTQKNFKPSQIIVEDVVQNSPLAQRIVARFPDLEKKIIPDTDALIKSSVENPDIKANVLLLAKQRGPFLRLCPGTTKHICCFYHNLDIAAGCDLDCSYCVLQGYLNTAYKTIYCNLSDMFDELDRKLSAKQFFRIGTGELTDSLTFEHITETGPELVRYFADKANAIIELKSKNIHIDDLLDIVHKRRTVISWSLNTPEIREKEEPLTPSIEDRLLAAREIQDAGYWIGFHFDPMIYYDGWEEGYRHVVDAIFKFAKPENIAWISLGALRYPHMFDSIIRENHPDSEIVLGELFPGIDKKLRYFKPLRVEMFSRMYKWLRAWSDDFPIYLCMESDEVWKKSFGWSPKSSSGLKKILDDRVK